MFSIERTLLAQPYLLCVYKYNRYTKEDPPQIQKFRHPAHILKSPKSKMAKCLQRCLYLFILLLFCVYLYEFFCDTNTQPLYGDCSAAYVFFLNDFLYQFSKVLCIVTLPSEYTGALNFSEKNSSPDHSRVGLCQGSRRAGGGGGAGGRGDRGPLGHLNSGVGGRKFFCGNGRSAYYLEA